MAAKKSTKKKVEDYKRYASTMEGRRKRDTKSMRASKKKTPYETRMVKQEQKIQQKTGVRNLPSSYLKGSSGLKIKKK